MKQQKKQSKKEQIERDEAIKEKLRESQKLFAVLDAFAKEEVRQDFLLEQNGATFKLTQAELDLLDEFSKLVQGIELGAKLESNTAEAADHLLSLIEAKNKQVQALESNRQVTYADLRKVFDRILSSSYWTKDTTAAILPPPPPQVEVPVVEPVVVEEAVVEQQQPANVVESNLIEPLNNLALEKPTDNLIHNSMLFFFFDIFFCLRVF